MDVRYQRVRIYGIIKFTPSDHNLVCTFKRRKECFELPQREHGRDMQEAVTL